jgi:thermitase
LASAAREPAPFVPNDSLYHLSQVGLESMSVQQAWRVTRGIRAWSSRWSTRASVADPDLAPNLLPGYNAIDGSSDTTDENGHGSEQAALIGAVLDNGLGASGICGRCRVSAGEGLRGGRDGRASTRSPRDPLGADQGVEVINLSFALESGSAPSPLLNEAIADAVGPRHHGRGRSREQRQRRSRRERARRDESSDDPRRLDRTRRDHGWTRARNRGAWVDVARVGGAVGAGSGAAPVGNGGTSAAAAAVSAISGLLLSVQRRPHARRTSRTSSCAPRRRTTSTSSRAERSTPIAR